MNLPEHKPRRAYDEGGYPGYLESDRDYLGNNCQLATMLLDAHAQGRLSITEVGYQMSLDDAFVGSDAKLTK